MVDGRRKLNTKIFASSIHQIKKEDSKFCFIMLNTNLIRFL